MPLSYPSHVCCDRRRGQALSLVSRALALSGYLARFFEGELLRDVNIDRHASSIFPPADSAKLLGLTGVSMEVAEPIDAGCSPAQQSSLRGRAAIHRNPPLKLHSLRFDCLKIARHALPFRAEPSGRYLARRFVPIRHFSHLYSISTFVGRYILTLP